MRPQQHALSRYHARWYAITIPFLAFGMEMIFMYTRGAVVAADTGAGAVVAMFGFLAVLLMVSSTGDGRARSGGPDPATSDVGALARPRVLVVDAPGTAH